MNVVASAATAAVGAVITRQDYRTAALVAAVMTAATSSSPDGVAAASAVVSSYEQITTFDQRHKLSKQLIQKYPNHVPVIIEPSPHYAAAHPGCATETAAAWYEEFIPQSLQPLVRRPSAFPPLKLPKTKYLMNRSTTVRKIIKKLVETSSVATTSSTTAGAIVLSFRHSPHKPPLASYSLIGDIFDIYKAGDGFLYLTFSEENRFGH